MAPLAEPLTPPAGRSRIVPDLIGPRGAATTRDAGRLDEMTIRAGRPRAGGFGRVDPRWCGSR